jgi:hypothetical protein
MMAKPLSTLPNVRLLAAFIATNIAVLVSSPFRAANGALENAGAVASIQGSSAHHAVDGSGIADVFAARWAGLNDQFSVGADGKIRPASLPVTESVSDKLPSSPEQALAETIVSQIDVEPDAGSAAAVSECGPSPMAPSQIAQLVVAAANEHGVDPEFALAVATAESRLDRFRNSPKGARGPMQLMPATAERFGVDEICDPASNIDGGVRFLRELFDRLQNPLLVAAAYNAGEARVRDHGGIPPFPETLNFVAKVTNRQLRLPEIAAHDRRNPSESKPLPDSSAPATGVITTTERRQWIGGVMHF